jgi:hypothetical protein
VTYHYGAPCRAHELPRATKLSLRMMARIYFYAIHGTKWPDGWHTQNYYVWEAFRQAGWQQYWATTDQYVGNFLVRRTPPDFTKESKQFGFEGPEYLNELAMICAWFLTIKEFDLGSIDPRTVKRWTVDIVTKRLEGE